MGLRTRALSLMLAFSMMLSILPLPRAFAADNASSTPIEMSAVMSLGHDGDNAKYGYPIGSGMKEVFYSPKDTAQQDLFSLVDNVKDDRTSGDLLFQVMLELGATLDSKIEESMVDDKTIYNVGDGYLVACFDEKVTDEVVKTIAKMQPMYAVLRDTSMADDATATNFEQIFKTYAPNTTTKIL